MTRRVGSLKTVEESGALSACCLSRHAERHVPRARPGAAGAARTVCSRLEVSARDRSQVLRGPEREGWGAPHLPPGAAAGFGVSALQEAA